MNIATIIRDTINETPRPEGGVDLLIQAYLPPAHQTGGSYGAKVRAVNRLSEIMDADISMTQLEVISAGTADAITALTRDRVASSGLAEFLAREREASAA